MARLAGKRLRERSSNWHREPFTGDSRNHISVWGEARKHPLSRCWPAAKSAGHPSDQ